MTTWTRLCNFMCVKLISNNGYMERNHGKHYEVMLVRQRTKYYSERNDEKRIYYLALNDNNRAASLRIRLHRRRGEDRQRDDEEHFGH